MTRFRAGAIRPLSIWAGAFCLALLVGCGPAAALDLILPANARQTVARNTDPDRYAAPVGVFADGQVARVNLDGAVQRAAYRLESSGLTPLQVMQPLRAQLVNAGFDIALDCADASCGGFDFRFAIETLPGPNMYVNIRAFHFVTALKMGSDGLPAGGVTVLTSTTATSAYVQIIQAGDLGDVGAEIAEPAPPLALMGTATGQVDLTVALMADGHAVLTELDFGTGTSDLGRGPFASLDRLAEFLRSRPAIKVALVGHTDAVGGLEGNIALSRRRAQSVRQRLIDAYGVAPGRVDAQGMGYLAPIASNLTDAGREANRRVEVVLLSAE